MKSLNEILETRQAIEGFHVMEWLRGVRDANYELSINNPEKYCREEEESKRYIDLLNRIAKKDLKK